MMQFKVPQDVLRPDKIVGFLTLRQLVIVTIGGGITYSVYIALNKQYGIEIWLLPVLFLGLITAAFAFFKFHDIIFEKFILIFIEYKFRPRRRTWQKMRGDTLISVFNQPARTNDPSKTGATVLTDSERRKKLEEISKLIDAQGKEILTKQMTINKDQK